MFSAQCNKIDEHNVNIDNLIEDILASLIELKRKNFEHNDIKLDNIVETNEKKYKLIDWGQSDYITDSLPTKIGTRIGTNPMRWYIKERKKFTNYFLGSSFLAPRHTELVAYFEKERFGNFGSFHGFIETNNRILKEYTSITKSLSVEDIRKKYKFTYDVFMLGMTVLHAAFLKGANADNIYNEYRPVIDAFTSLHEPLDAEQALSFFLHRKEIIEQSAAP